MNDPSIGIGAGEKTRSRVHASSRVHAGVSDEHGHEQEYEHEYRRTRGEPVERYME